MRLRFFAAVLLLAPMLCSAQTAGYPIQSLQGPPEISKQVTVTLDQNACASVSDTTRYTVVPAHTGYVLSVQKAVFSYKYGTSAFPVNGVQMWVVNNGTAAGPVTNDGAHVVGYTDLKDTGFLDQVADTQIEADALTDAGGGVTPYAVATFANQPLVLSVDAGKYIAGGAVGAWSLHDAGAGYALTDTGSVATDNACTAVLSGASENYTVTRLTSAGTGYAANDTFTVNGGGTLAAGVVDTVGAAGDVLTYHLTSGGDTYAAVANVDTTATSGTGTGFQIDITAVDGGTGEITASTLAVLGGIAALTLDGAGTDYPIVSNTCLVATAGFGANATLDITSVTGSDSTLSITVTYSEIPVP